MFGIKKELQRQKPMKVSINEITLTENMNIFHVKTQQGFLNLIGCGTFFCLKKNGCETNYGFVDNLCFIYEGEIECLGDSVKL